MLAITEQQRSAYGQLRSNCHPGCVVCCPSNGHGFGLEFHVAHDGAVEASFACDSVFQGYPATLHGGVICALLDGAMTNCLFAHGYASMTVELSVQFRHPVATDNPAIVRAWITSETRPIYELAAELIQDELVKATAKAKFFEKAAMNWFGKVAQ